MKIWIIVLAVCVTFCSSAFAGTPPPSKSEDFYFDLSDDSRSGERSGKFVAVLLENGALDIHLIPSTFASFHAEFVKATIHPSLEVVEINRRSQYTSGRQYFFGSLYASEIVSAGDDQSQIGALRYNLVSRDLPSIAELILLDQSLKKFLAKVLVKKPMAYSPLSKFNEASGAMKEALARAGVALQLTEPSATSEAIYTSGWAVGTILRLTSTQAKEALEKGDTFLNQILVIEGAPDDLPPAAGYIFSSTSSPNSHPALLAQMLSVPLVFMKDAYHSPAMIKLETERKQVLFQAATQQEAGVYQKQKVYVGAIDADSMSQLSRLKVTPKIGDLRFQPGVADLIESQTYTGAHLDAAAYGAKAAGLVEIQRSVSVEYTIPSLFIPLYYQQEFLKHAMVRTTEGSMTLRALIDQTLLGIDRTPGPEMAIKLVSIRNAIMTAEISDEVLKPLMERLETFASATGASKLFFRSSSNAEDHEVFNGAGLYDSKGSVPNRIAMNKAIRTVWASLYNYKAFWARRQFSINESTVGMGIVVQGFLENVEAQGVMIAKARDNVTDLRMTTFPGLLQVTSPPAGKTPESVRLIGGAGDMKDVEVVTYCQDCDESLRERELILKDQEYKDVSVQVDRLLARWPKTLDIEWLKSNGRIYFVQSRLVPTDRLLSRTIYAGNPSYTIRRHSHDGDSGDPAILRLQGEIEMNLSLNTGTDFSAALIGSVSYRYKGFSKVLKGSDLRVTLVPGGEGSVDRLVIPLKHPKYPSLVLHVSKPGIYSDNADRLKGEIANPSDLQYELLIDGNTIFPNTRRKSKKQYFYEDLTQLTPYRIQLRQTTSPVVPEIKANWHIAGKLANRGEIAINVDYVRDNDEKHYGLILKRVEIKGLVRGKTITFTKPEAMSYTAGDHHLDPELALDLTKADQPVDLTGLLDGGRYLWIFSVGVGRSGGPGEGPGGVAGVSEDGRWLREITTAKDGALDWR